VIERTCGPTRRAETHTDTKGQFSFQIGGGVTNTEQLLDASSSSIGMRLPGTAPASTTIGSPSSTTSVGGRPTTNTDLRGCELRAVLGGYRSSIVSLATHFNFDNPDIGLIVLKRLGPTDGTTVSMTNALAPKDAKRAYEKGRQQIAKGNVAEARSELSKAVEIYPKYASAWAELGRIEMDLNEPVEAKQAFQNSLAADPNYLPPYERLAVLSLRKRNWQELVDITNRLIQLGAYEYPQVYYYNALAYLNLNQADPAEKSARLALKQDPEKFVRAYYVLGLALAQHGDFAGAVESLKTYVAAEPNLPEIDQVKKQLADLEKLATAQTARKEREQQQQ
jgi:tetratricopeptide (TPR) repeat protein